MDGADAGTPAAGIDFRVEEHYRGIAEKIVGKVMKTVDNLSKTALITDEKE